MKKTNKNFKNLWMELLIQAITAFPFPEEIQKDGI